MKFDTPPDVGVACAWGAYRGGFLVQRRDFKFQRELSLFRAYYRLTHQKMQLTAICIETQAVISPQALEHICVQVSACPAVLLALIIENFACVRYSVRVHTFFVRFFAPLGVSLMLTFAFKEPMLATTPGIQTKIILPRKCTSDE